MMFWNYIKVEIKKQQKLNFLLTCKNYISLSSFGQGTLFWLLVWSKQKDFGKDPILKSIFFCIKSKIIEIKFGKISFLGKNAKFPQRSPQELLKFAAKLMIFSKKKSSNYHRFWGENLGMKPKNGFCFCCRNFVEWKGTCSNEI